MNTETKEKVNKKVRNWQKWKINLSLSKSEIIAINSNQDINPNEFTTNAVEISHYSEYAIGLQRTTKKDKYQLLYKGFRKKTFGEAVETNRIVVWKLQISSIVFSLNNNIRYVVHESRQQEEKRKTKCEV